MLYLLIWNHNELLIFPLVSWSVIEGLRTVSLLTKWSSWWTVAQTVHNCRRKVREGLKHCLVFTEQDNFSNSLIIHQVKTKKSQLWRRFGYPVLISIDLDGIIRLLLSFCFDCEDISNTRGSAGFIGYPNTSNFKNTPLRVVSSTLFSVFEYPDEIMYLVFDIL